MRTLRPILLIEDNDDDVVLTLTAFEENNIANEVIVLRDGAEALDYLYCRGAHAERDPAVVPQIVFLDLKLPKIDGLAVLREIRAYAPTAHLPVVMLTSSDEDRDILEAYQLGVNSYVRKPVDFNQFLAVARELGLYWLVLNELSDAPRSP